ncbi:MAG: hypothetical protein IT184_02630 [Acidobacteria bacterium]|nr:hypothetical protein [Acidobacteriota bacterium]
MTFPVEVVLKGQDRAVTAQVTVPYGAPATWTDAAVHDVLVEILRAIDRVQNPAAAPDRTVVLHGFSWIVEPADEQQVVVAIEIPMGAAVAGPFAIGQVELDGMITRVLRAERQQFRPTTVH